MASTPLRAGQIRRFGPSPAGLPSPFPPLPTGSLPGASFYTKPSLQVVAMDSYMRLLSEENLDGSKEIWDDTPFGSPPEEQTRAVAQGSQPTRGNAEGSQPTERSKKRTKNFSVQEDEKLISAWLNVSLDAIESNDQSMSRYWQRIHAAFHEHKEFESDRSENSLLNRWSNINANVSRFCGVYAQVMRRKQSGLTEQDKMQHAKTLYKNSHPKKQSFVMEHCWILLRHEQKWIHRKDKSQNETTSEQAPSGASPLNYTSGSNEVPQGDLENSPTDKMTRPPGKKQEKEGQRRGKRPCGDGENHLKEVMSDFWINKKETEYLRELRKKERNDERLQLERERLELQRKDVEMKERSEDERIINIDISTMSPDQQQFYKMLKDEIFTRRFGKPPVRGDTASI